MNKKHLHAYYQLCVDLETPLEEFHKNLHIENEQKDCLDEQQQLCDTLQKFLNEAKSLATAAYATRSIN